MPYPNLTKLAATLPAPNLPYPLLFTLVDAHGTALDSVRLEAESNKAETLHEAKLEPHLPESLHALRDLASHQIFQCPNGCCIAVALHFHALDTAFPLPASKKKFRFAARELYLFATFDKDAQPLERQLIHLYTSALARELAERVVADEVKDRSLFAEKIVGSMSSGFLVLLPDMTVTHANEAAAELLQTTLDRLVGSPLTDFIVSELRVRSVFLTKKPFVDKELFIKLPNKTLHMIKTCVPVFDDEGEVIAALDHFREIKEAHQLVSHMSGTKAVFTFDDIIYRSESMASAVELARLASASDLSVLIHGESGTGKEMFAHAVHQASKRANAPFVVIDCASMPRDLVESELFGYAEGAFTGARRGGRPGKFELANGGTIFLDELGELPLELQSRLLRVLQSREVMRVGGVERIAVDIRVIAATNRNLIAEIQQGNFRADLYHRLNVLPIMIPSLRSRPEDIIALAEYFLEKHKLRFGRADVFFAPDVLDFLQQRPWLGNARELDNAVVRAVHVCRDVITIKDMMPTESMLRDSVLPGDLYGDLAFDLSGMFNDSRANEYNRPSAGHPSRGQDYIASGVLPQTGSLPHNATSSSLDEITHQALLDAVASVNGNISQAARMLGIARSTVYKRLRR